MLLRNTRHVLPLLCVMCPLVLAFPTQAPSAFDDVRSLQVNIPHSGPVSAPLGGSISIPCLASLAYAQPAAPHVVPRIKWSVVSGGVETQILVARGQRVKVNEVYRGRAALLNYTSSPEDLSLSLGDLRSSDSGHYRCEVQQGLEDASDIVQLKVKGVVFHYRDALGRYAFTFQQAQRACEAIGAEIATIGQLTAAYYDGYEQCDAGWLADQSVRYPIQFPREACYGDMDGQPGVRNYGIMEPEDLFDVYCYMEQMQGEVLHEGSVPLQLSFPEAQSYCRAAGAELATTAQLYLAWREGLDRCSPGWLSDGSVRYPIITPRERCGGPQAGVKTLYRFSNQTGFPEPSSLHDVYCFKASQSEPIGLDIVILTEREQELQLNQFAEQVEREVKSVLESFAFVPRPSTVENLPHTQTTEVYGTTDSSLNTTSPSDSLLPFDETSLNTTGSNGTYEIPQTALVLPTVHNETDSHQDSNVTFHQTEHESTTGLPETSYLPYTHNQTVPGTEQEDHPKPSQSSSQEVQDNTLNLNTSQANHSETDHKGTQEESILATATGTPDNWLQVTVEETSFAEPEVTSLATQSPSAEEEVHTEMVKTGHKQLTSPFWLPTDGSGAASQETDVDVEAATFTTSSGPSSSGLTTHQLPSSSLSSTPSVPSTSVPDLTTTSDTLSTAAQMWESSISKEEGSTSLESGDIVTGENEEKQLPPTKAGDNLTFGADSTTALPSQESNSSQHPTDPSKVLYRTSGYRAYWDTATLAYEEASGQEAGTVTAIFGEDDESHPTVAEVNVSTTPEEDMTVNPFVEDETKLDDDSTDSPIPEEETNVTPTFAVDPEFVTALGEDIHMAPTLEEDQDLEKVIVSTTSKEEHNITPTLENEINVAPTREEFEVNQTPEEETNVSIPVDEVAKVVISLEEESNIDYNSEEEVNLAPTDEENTVFPNDSQTSNWTLLTTATEPQESLNDHVYSRKTSSVTSTAAPRSFSSTKPTRAPTATTTTTITTTTHWSKRAWSPTTSAPRVFNKTSEPQEVTRRIPQVDRGVGDGEISDTQAPTLLVLPSERVAAVGGAGRASDVCVTDPCLNGGTCTERNGQIKCLCLATYGGDFCQKDLERCEPGWEKFHGSCYRHFSQRLSWEVAEQHCRMLGAHLVSIMSPEEQAYISSNYKEYQWTGLNDKTIEDDFRWSDGNQLLYENWYRGQPDSYFLSGEDCVVMVWHDDGRWSDVPCNYHLAYTCKKGTSSCGPPPKLRNASIFGKARHRYETNAVVRYHCADGFQQRLNPLIRCLSDGVWERPQIMCTPVAGDPVQQSELTPLTNNLAVFEDELEATKETPQYWDIKF